MITELTRHETASGVQVILKSGSDFEGILKEVYSEELQLRLNAMCPHFRLSELRFSRYQWQVTFGRY